MQTFSFYSDGRLTIRFCGELDHAAASSAMRAVTEAAGEYLPRTCVLDLSGLTFMDSSGIAVILRAQRLPSRWSLRRSRHAGCWSWQVSARW